MKKQLFFLALIMTLASITVLQSCKSSSKASASKVLKFNLAEGKGYDYEMIWDMDTKAGGQESGISVTGLYSMNVTSIEGNVRSVTTAYKSLRLNMNMMGLTIDINSDKPIDNNEKDILKNPIGMMNKVVSGLIGKKFIMKVDEDGKVLDVIGFEKILTGMIDSMGIEGDMKQQVETSLKDQFNNQSIKDQFSQVFTIFPNKEVKPGDTWEKSFSTGGKMAAKYTTNYTVKSIEGDHVILAADTKISSAGGNNDLTGTQTGNIIVDSNTGLMINAEFQQDMKMKAEGVTVDITGKGKIKGTAN